MNKWSMHELVLTGLILWMGSYAYLYIYQLTDFKPLYTYCAFLGFAVFFVLSALGAAKIRGRGTQHLLTWLLAFAIYTSVSWLIASHSAAATQIFITWMEGALILGAFSFLFCNAKKLEQIQVAFVLIAIIGVVLNCYDFILPTFSNVPGRAAGLYENPNIAGKFIAMSMVAGIGVVPRSIRLWYVLLCGLGVLVTFSRSAWLLWFIGVFFLGWVGVIGAVRYQKISTILIAILTVTMLGLLFDGKLAQIAHNSSLAKYLDPNTSARLGIGGGQFEDRSTSMRIELAKEALAQGAEAPVLGHGLGFTRERDGWIYSSSTHNMYLLLWAEGGIVGLAVYLWLMILLVYHSNGVGRVIALQYVFAGFMTHNLLDQPAGLIVLALVCVLRYPFDRRAIDSSQPLQAPGRA